MTDAVNVVVTCTKDKSVLVDADCALRSVPKGTMRKRTAEWRRRLSSRSRKRVSVGQLYTGDHWSIVRSFDSRRFRIHVWVCSAGYGLIQMSDLITPYSATFSSTHPDSVCRNVTDVTGSGISSVWWHQMAQWQGHWRGNPRSLRELAASFPRRAMLVVASEIYLRAIAGDLCHAVNELSDPDLLSIISAGSRSVPGLDDHLVPCDARLQSLVGGARRSLNTRVAKKVLSEARSLPRRSTLIRKYRRLLQTQPEIAQHDRVPMSDAEISEFISSRLQDDESLCHTPLLRLLRQSGRACEQSRFASLYRVVKERPNGATKTN